MVSNLIRIPFAEALLQKVQGFDCGNEPWEKEVSNWIKAPRGADGAIDAMDYGAEVWLYSTQGGELAAFGSLSTTLQHWPRSKDPKVLVSILPVLGLDKKFWNEPKGPREQRYSTQVLDDLIAEAKKHAAERPVLILYVNEKNARAIKFYLNAGFKKLHKPWTDRTTGFVNKRMALVLTSP